MTFSFCKNASPGDHRLARVGVQEHATGVQVPWPTSPGCSRNCQDYDGRQQVAARPDVIELLVVPFVTLIIYCTVAGAMHALVPASRRIVQA